MRWTLAIGMVSLQQQGRLGAVVRRRPRARARRSPRRRPGSAACRRAAARASRRASPDSRCRAPAPSRTTGRPATISSWIGAWSPRANSRSLRIEVRAQPLVVDRIPVEHQDVGRHAGRERTAVVLVGDGETAVLERHAQHRRAVDLGCRIAAALMQQMREPHFAQRIVVLVEASSRRGRAPRGSRACTISSSGAMPERRCRFELVLTEIVAPRAAISSSLVRPRPGAMGERQPRR